MDLSRALATAIETARQAGDLLRRDFHRPGGPRGGGDKAEADLEAEHLIRSRLRAAFPDWGYLGEETGRDGVSAGGPVWLVDPNDGTRDYLVGRRGSAVSIALVDHGRPVLGVVFAWGYPDDTGDLFSWAEGCGPILRNGSPAIAPPPPSVLGPLHTVLVSGRGDRDPQGNLACSAPARYRSLPSIAHRLALVAVGEGEVTNGVFAPRDWDYAGGHALLRAAGGGLVDEHGREIQYAEDGSSRCRRAFAGSREAAVLLSARPWESVDSGPWTGERPARLKRGEAVADSALLSRAQGCLLGQAAGDSLGALVEGKSAAEIEHLYPEGPRFLEDGGVFALLAGQPTDDTEMALALARSILAFGTYAPSAAFEAYSAWGRSSPFSLGRTTLRALEGRLDPESQANGSLMRASPLGVFAHALPPSEAAALAHADSRLTHPHPVCGDSVAAYVLAIAAAVRGHGAQAAYEATLDWALQAPAETAVREALVKAASSPPACEGAAAGWVLVALQNAFYELLHAERLEAGVVASVRRGGDTDTNAAVAGALLGAVHGRPAVPAQWRRMILSCHPVAPVAARPRPMSCWPVDVLEIAERLLLAGAPPHPPTSTR